MTFIRYICHHKELITCQETTQKSKIKDRCVNLAMILSPLLADHPSHLPVPSFIPTLVVMLPSN